MTAVVTGASGHLGANLVRALLAAGVDVRAIVHEDRRALRGVDCACVEADIRDIASLRRAFAGADVVYHLAGYVSILMSDWPQSESVNVLGTRNVVQACLDCGVRRLVHFSSISAYVQEPVDEVLNETRPRVSSPLAPPYDRSKAASEREVRGGIARGLDAVILNPTSVIGPHDYKPSHFGQALIAIVRRELPALVGGGVDWVDARDVADCAMRAAERAPRGAQYIVSGSYVSVRELARMAGEISGVRVPRFVFPLGLVRMAAPFAVLWARMRGERATFTTVMVRALQGCRAISHTRATRELGYTARPFHTTLQDTLRWFSEQGLLGKR